MDKDEITLVPQHDIVLEKEYAENFENDTTITKIICGIDLTNMAKLLYKRNQGKWSSRCDIYLMQVAIYSADTPTKYKLIEYLEQNQKKYKNYEDAYGNNLKNSIKRMRRSLERPDVF